MDDSNTNDTEETANVKFVGDPADDFSGPSKITMFGQEFTKGEYAEVTDPAIIRKLRNHSHFAFEGETVDKVNVEKDDLPALSLEHMKDVARAEGVEFEDDTTKPKLMRAIRAKRKADAA